jgi:hypothetical protein
LAAFACMKRARRRAPVSCRTVGRFTACWPPNLQPLQTVSRRDTNRLGESIRGRPARVCDAAALEPRRRSGKALSLQPVPSASLRIWELLTARHARGDPAFLNGNMPGPVPVYEGRINVLQEALTRQFGRQEIGSFHKSTTPADSQQHTRLDAWKRRAGPTSARWRGWPRGPRRSTGDARPLCRFSARRRQWRPPTPPRPSSCISARSGRTVAGQSARRRG